MKKRSKKLFEKAGKHSIIADFYKNSHPNLHLHHHQRYMHYMNDALKANQEERLHRNQARTGRIRFLHAAPGAQNVDVYLNGARILQNHPYKKASSYLTLPAGEYQLDMYPAGNQEATLLSRKINVSPGKMVTLASGGSGKYLKLFSFTDDPTIFGEEAALRFTHLSPDSPAVNLSVKHADDVFKDIAYGQTTEYLSVTPMTIDLELRSPTNKDNVILPLPPITIQPGIPYTMYAAGQSGGDPALEIILLSP